LINDERTLMKGMCWADTPEGCEFAEKRGPCKPCFTYIAHPPVLYHATLTEGLCEIFESGGLRGQAGEGEHDPVHLSDIDTSWFIRDLWGDGTKAVTLFEVDVRGLKLTIGWDRGGTYAYHGDVIEIARLQAVRTTPPD
jgi:hypothetical protein